MFLNYFKWMFSHTYYVQIWENRLKITCIETNKVFDVPPLVAIRIDKKGKKTIVAFGSEAELSNKNNCEIVNPFSHPRTLLADFTVAEKLLQHAIKNLSESKPFSSTRAIVMHPMEKLEGDLTQIEQRAFRELGAGAGASEVYIHTGSVIPLDSFDSSKF